MHPPEPWAGASPALVGWAAPDGRVREEERVPPRLFLAGKPVPRGEEGTVLLLQAFRATVERGEPPPIPVRPAVAVSLVGVAGAESLRNGSRPVPVPAIPEDVGREP